MAFIAFLGCDGSGKSAVIRALADRFEAEGCSVWLGHWRPTPFRVSSASAGKKAATASVEDPHGQARRGRLASIVKLGWLATNWWTAWLRGLRGRSRTGQVLFDRYYLDLLVDPMRYRYDGPVWLVRIASRMLPRPDRVFFLDAPPEVLLSRKQEVTREALVASRARYLEVCREAPECEIIDATKPLEEVIEDVYRLIPGSKF
ncbi:MAG: dTMP kinase [Verrucomicrobiales bacterium]